MLFQGVDCNLGYKQKCGRDRQGLFGCFTHGENHISNVAKLRFLFFVFFAFVLTLQHMMVWKVELRLQPTKEWEGNLFAGLFSSAFWLGFFFLLDVAEGLSTSTGWKPQTLQLRSFVKLRPCGVDDLHANWPSMPSSSSESIAGMESHTPSYALGLPG